MTDAAGVAVSASHTLAAVPSGRNSAEVSAFSASVFVVISFLLDLGCDPGIILGANSFVHDDYFSTPNAKQADPDERR
ncbi:hypothetical protein GCM10009734_50620 [Nonomuraea bangladeshensis]